MPRKSSQSVVTLSAGKSLADSTRVNPRRGPQDQEYLLSEGSTVNHNIERIFLITWLRSSSEMGDVATVIDSNGDIAGDDDRVRVVIEQALELAGVDNDRRATVLGSILELISAAAQQIHSAYDSPGAQNGTLPGDRLQEDGIGRPLSAAEQLERFRALDRERARRRYEKLKAERPLPEPRQEPSPEEVLERRRAMGRAAQARFAAKKRSAKPTRTQPDPR